MLEILERRGAGIVDLLRKMDMKGKGRELPIQEKNVFDPINVEAVLESR
jgi:hypothetical protein